MSERERDCVFDQVSTLCLVHGGRYNGTPACPLKSPPKMTAYEKYIARLFCVIGFICGVLITIGLISVVSSLMALLK